MADEILIQELELAARVGVPDIERATPQRLVASLRFEPMRAFSELDDDIERTVDYHALAEAVKAFVARTPPRKLLETLAGDIAAEVLRQFEVRAVEVELRKFILPGTRFVAVRVRRERREYV